ncbi:hypothetical protein HPB47_020109, partial [Ixodes persulcatus]
MVLTSRVCRPPAWDSTLAIQKVGLSGMSRRLAEAKKEEGNELYKQKKYEDAIKLYTEAI